eukprot:390273-Pelagomonas_calceolata.AAC.4
MATHAPSHTKPTSSRHMECKVQWQWLNPRDRLVHNTATHGHTPASTYLDPLHHACMASPILWQRLTPLCGLLRLLRQLGVEEGVEEVAAGAALWGQLVLEVPAHMGLDRGSSVGVGGPYACGSGM